MSYSDEFMIALNAWQKGWKENLAKKQELSENLMSVSTDIPKSSLMIPCYMKWFLQIEHLVGFFLEGELHVGLTSWSIDKEYAENFKGLVRDGMFTALYRYVPQPNEIIINTNSLWKDKDFLKRLGIFKEKYPNDSLALEHFKDSQGEIVLNCTLHTGNVIGFCSHSSDFDILCNSIGLRDAATQEHIYKSLIQQGIHPDEPGWTSHEGAQRAIKRARELFLEQVYEARDAR